MRLSWAVLAAAMSLAARAAAQESQESDEPFEEEPSAEETAPPQGEPPAVAPPPEAVPALPADADAGFGFAGQLTISDDLQMVATRTSTEGQSGHLDSIQLHPAVDFFPAANLSIGGQVLIEYAAFDNAEYDSAVMFGLLARLGYNIPFSPKVSLWPKVALGYRHVSGANSPGPSNSSISAVPFQLYVPVIVQVTSHFFVGGGPSWRTDLYYKVEGDVYGPKTSEIGLLSTLGGYFKVL